MSKPPSQPDGEADWSRLPQDPVGFFRLEANFEPRDLKRAYNRLLRRYKPEKHPDEFQRIRAAYEDLDQQLRYGVAITLHAANSWDHSPSESNEVPANHAPSADPLETLAEEIESGGAAMETLLGRLKGQAEKTAADFYALALLADATQPAEEHHFLLWLIKGVSTHPNEPALERLLQGWLASQAPEKLLPQILFTCAKQISGDAYYRITEAGWDRLLRGPSAANFAPLLRKCQAALAKHPGCDPAISARIAFTIHALRFALWKDKSGWANEALAFLDENFDQVPPHLEHELDTLMFVREYIECREEFISGHPLREELDNVLETAFTTDPIEADQRVVACQQRLGEASEELADAFSWQGEPSHNAFFSLWSWVSEDVAARASAHEEPEPDLAFWQKRVARLLVDLKQKSSWTGTLWNLASIARGFAFPVTLMTLVGITLVVTLLMSIYLGETIMGNRREELVEVSIVTALVCAAVVAALTWKRLRRLIEDKIWQPFCRRTAKRCYRLLWRPGVLDYVRHSSLDYFAFRDLVNEEASYTNDERTWICLFASQDYGLAMAALAQRFRS